MTTQTECIPLIPGFRPLRVLSHEEPNLVFLAVQESLDRLVVVKSLGVSVCTVETESRQQLEQEAFLLCKVSHPNVIRVYDRVEYDGEAYLILEFVEGMNLREFTEHTEKLPLHEVRRILDSIGKAVAALHEDGILHGDLKPENILLDQHGMVRIIDFGIACTHLRQSDFSNLRAMGTPGYAAPEQRNRLPMDTRVDQYALAVLAHELLTGQLPEENSEPPSTINAELTSDVDRVIQRGLLADPEDRYPSVQEFSQALLHELELCAQPANLSTKSRFWWWSAAVAAMTVCIGVGAAIGSSLVSEKTVNLADTESPAEESPVPAADTITVFSDTSIIPQTGVLPFRIRNGIPEVLMVSSRSGTHWTVPKATTTHASNVTALLHEEALEEAGVRGRPVLSSVGSYRYVRNDQQYDVTVFPLEVSEILEEWPEQFRERRWFHLDEVAAHVPTSGLRAILIRFASESGIP